MNISSLTIVAAVMLIATSCTSTKHMEESKTSLPFYGTKWNLNMIHDANTGKQVSTKAFIRFDEAKQSGGGNGSCNSFGSNIKVEGDKLSISNIFSTKMYCEDVQQTENSFFNLLGKTTVYKVKGNTLKLYNGNTLLLEFIGE